MQIKRDIRVIRDICGRLNHSSRLLFPTDGTEFHADFLSRRLPQTYAEWARIAALACVGVPPNVCAPDGTHER